jgi:hypothetical protein
MLVQIVGVTTAMLKYTNGSRGAGCWSLLVRLSVRLSIICTTVQGTRYWNTRKMYTVTGRLWYRTPGAVLAGTEYWSTRLYNLVLEYYSTAPEHVSKTQYGLFLVPNGIRG